MATRNAPKAQPVKASPATTPTMADVEYKRPELVAVEPRYQLISDALAGSEAVKSRGTTYLPMPNASDTSAENKKRYEAYITRAVYYGVAERTLSGMVGEVFKVPPIIRVPDLLNPVLKDAAGNGVSLEQQAKECHTLVTAKGRAGLLVDYPRTSGVVTRAQQLDGTIKPTITLYRPETIINWRTASIGGRILLTLVVLQEQYEVSDDGFKAEVATQYRVLRLVEGKYRVEIWRKGTKTASFAPVPELTAEPTDAQGQSLDEIPFTFVGSVDNSATVDPSPMYALCDLNIAHYRNSADYEESVYITGQSTPVITGLTTQWAKDILGDKVHFGSQTAIMLPSGADAKLLQMDERTAAFAAMEHKEKQMVALGAKLVETKTVQRTATESRQDEASETSILTTITQNVSAAYQWCLEWAAIFHGALSVREDASIVDDDKRAILFKLNTDFDIMSVSFDEVTKTIDAWMKDAITFTEMRNTLRRAKLATQSDEDAVKEIRDHRMDDGDFDRQHKLGAFAHEDDDTGGDEE